jgi:uncharacterized protein
VEAQTNRGMVVWHWLNKRVVAASIVAVIVYLPNIGHAQSTWDAKRVASLSAPKINLMNASGITAGAVDRDNMRNIVSVFENMSRQVGIPAEFYISDMAGVNAYATNRTGVNVVVMSLGMVNIFAGENDMYAAIIGHELAHLSRGHLEEGKSREAVLGLIGFIAGLALDVTLAGRYQINTNIGRILGDAGATLASRKFSRDQEREADQLGVQWMHQAGYDPQASVRLWQRMPAGSDSFLDTHPASDERAQNITTYLATLPAQSNKQVATKFTPIKLSDAEMQVANFKYEESAGDDPFVLALNAYNEGRVDEAFKYAKQSSDAGDPRGQFGVGFAYYAGIVVKQDFKVAADYFQKSADQGSSIANTYLGVMYQHGLGVKKDYQLAVVHLQKAADTGYPNALAHLGEMYYAGQGVEKNPEKALQLVTQAANKQDAYGEYYLGHALYLGWGGAVKDYARAESLLKSAASRSIYMADSLLGHYYSQGIATTPDYAKALEHLKKADAKSDLLAKYLIGSLYFKGNGVEKDYSKAKQYFVESFQRGLGNAGAEMSTMYVMGYGVQKDLVKAYAWIEAAATKGLGHPAYIDLRNRLNAALTPDQKAYGISLTKSILAGTDI